MYYVHRYFNVSLGGLSGVTVVTMPFCACVDSTIPESNEEEREEKTVVEPPMTADEIPAEAADAVVPLDALYRVMLRMFFNTNNTHPWELAKHLPCGSKR